jgi:hypothetical protein
VIPKSLPTRQHAVDVSSVRPRWAIELLGPREVLADVRLLFKNTEPSVSSEILGGDRTATLLFSTAFENLDNRRAVYAAAKRQIERINGVLFLGNDRRTPINLAGGPMERAENGKWNYSLLAEPGVFHVAVDSAAASKSLAGEAVGDWIRAASDEPVDLVLKYLSNDPGWVDLYKIWECVAADVKKRKKLARVAFRLPNQDTIKAFRDGANKQDRHRPTEQHQMRPRMMDLSEGRKFIQELVRAWLRWRSSK